MKIKQTNLKYRFLPVLLLATFSMLFMSISLNDSPASAQTLTTWQTFIKHKCSGSTADAAEACANDLTDRLKTRCGEEADNPTYIRCWRTFINNNDGTAGPDSSPFEVEVAPDLSGTGNGCGGVETSIIRCNASNGGDLKDNGVWALLLLAINILTAGIGVAAVGGIVYGAVLYTSAGDKAEQVKKAIGVITNVVIGVLAYVAMYALLQFLIPGGVFS